MRAPALVIALTACGCNALFGVDELLFVDPPSSSDGGAPGAGGSNSGATGGTPASSSAGGGAGGDCSRDASWSVALAGYGKQNVRSVAVAPDGGAFVAGYFTSELEIAGNEREGPTYAQAFVTRLDPGGAHVWTRVLDSTGRAWPEQIAVAGDGVAVVGGFEGTMAGTFPLVSYGSLDIFVVLLDENGDTIWNESFGSAGEDVAQAVAVGPAGSVFVGGFVSGNVTFGTEAQTAAGGRDGFVVKLDPLGEAVWSELFGPTGDQYVRGLGVDSGGTLTVAGYYYSRLIAGALDEVALGDSDMFLLRMGLIGDVTGGQTFGSTAITAPSEADDRIFGVALDAAGNAVVVGTAADELTIDDVTIPSAGGGDVLVASFAPAGTLRWAELLGDEARQEGYSVAVGDDGGAVVTGYYQGSIDFGCGPLAEATGGDNMFVAALDQRGAVVWSSGFAAEGEQTVSFLGGSFDWRAWRSVALGPGVVVLGGFFQGTLDLGAGPLEGTATDIDGFAAAFPR